MKTQNHFWLFPLMAGFLLIALMSGCSSQGVKDIDGNVYKTVIIGDQEWFAENLKTTRYNDGSAIPNVTDDEQWERLSTGAFCWYDNDPGNGEIYGALYNWYAVDTGKLCPAGWRVPTDDDWKKLTDYLGGEDIAGGKLKATGTLEAGNGLWLHPNEGATNETGFMALPGGVLGSLGFDYLGVGTLWWSSIDHSSNLKFAWAWSIFHVFNELHPNYYDKQFGFSVRCLRDQ